MNKLILPILAIIILVSGCTSLPGQITIPASCGNGECDYYDNVQNIISEENFINCPSECSPPEDPAATSTQAIRPLVSGLRYTGDNVKGCSIGYITHQFGKTYILTAAHCIPGISHTGPYHMLNVTSDIIGHPLEQGHHYIGQVARVPKNYWLDLVLIEIADNVEATQMTLSGHKYSGYTTPKAGQRVMKVGTTTGLTYGTITTVRETYYLENRTERYYDMISIASDDVESGGYFCLSGDSGSAVLTADPPHKLVGILTGGNAGYCSAISTSTIIPQLNLYLAT